MGSLARPGGTGGTRDRRVGSPDERLSSAAHGPTSSAARDRIGAASTARSTAHSPAGSPSWSATTIPTRARPCNRALTRCPTPTDRPSGTASEKDRASGMSNTTSAITCVPMAEGAVARRAGAAERGGQAVGFLAGPLQIVPRHPLEALAGIPQQEGGMKRGDEDTGAVRVRLAPELGDAFLPCRGGSAWRSCRG